MPHRRSRKSSAIFLGWLLLILFMCQGMVYPVNGELGINTFEIVDLQVLGEPGEDELLSSSEETDSEVQLEANLTEVLDIQDQIKTQDSEAQSTAVEDEVKDMVINLTVQNGDTLSGIAQRYRTTIAELMQLNNLADPDSIFAGQSLKVPLKGVSSSLIASNASRGGLNISPEDLELLARVIHAEARGEDFVGQIAVGAVVLNRLADHRFPNTIREVIYQPGAFTAVSDKQIYLTPDQTAYRAAEAALNGEDPTDGAIYYYNPKTATDRWIKTRPVIKTIGNHAFSI